MEEIEERFKSGNFIFKTTNKKEQHLEKIQAYNSINQVPKDLPVNRIYLDTKNDTVILP